MIKKLTLAGNVRNRPHQKITRHFSAPLGMTVAQMENYVYEMAVAFENSRIVMIEWPIPDDGFVA